MLIAGAAYRSGIFIYISALILQKLYVYCIEGGEKRMVVVTGPDSNRSERLYRMVVEHEKTLLKICCMYLGDAALAQDAVQEVFIKAYKGMDAFRGDCSEKTWLTHIAVNVCRDFRRSAWMRYVDRRVSLDQLPLPSAPPSLDHLTLTKEIMRLPRRYMDVVLLYYYQNMKLKEIALALGISPAAVSGRLQKARKRLHGALEGGVGDEA